jgi:hypothetical protein
MRAMEIELLLILAVALPGFLVFGRFEGKTPKWRRLLKWGIYIGVAFLIGATAGRPWTFVWIAFLPSLGLTVHLLWCRKHGIHPLTAEPREKYYALRGWK